MEQLLSQDEIDALLKGISDGDVQTAKEGPDAAVAAEAGAAAERTKAQVFDFSKYTKGRKDKLPSLQVHFGQAVKVPENGPHLVSRTGGRHKHNADSVC